ncbi:MAG: type II toxin-antitoxin system ParD family antitoxin [Rhodothermia bacterium]|nr:MAG: type II toxin-antitoxin system ParD family antitoxin [Rhodothermia bacterium]
MNVSLTSKLEGMVKKLVKSGRYNSASEVVRDGLRLVDEREQLRKIKLQALREAIQEGLDSGPPTEWDVDEFKRDARKRRSGRSIT